MVRCRCHRTDACRFPPDDKPVMFPKNTRRAGIGVRRGSELPAGLDGTTQVHSAGDGLTQSARSWGVRLHLLKTPKPGPRSRPVASRRKPPDFASQILRVPRIAVE